MVYPNFRGPNNRPEACGSDFAVQDIEDAVDRVLNAGWRTADIAGEGVTPLGCTAMTDKILAEI